MRLIIPIILFLFTMTSCYKEITNVEPEADVFDLYVDNIQRDQIYNSRDSSFSVQNPSPQLFFNEQLLDLKDIRIRGRTALRYQRKSYAVFLNEPILVVNRYGTGTKELSRFKLLALANDYTYIENRVAFGLLQEAGVMPLLFKFVQVKINDDTQGIYLLVEDPEQYYKENDSEFILRRDYDHTIIDFDYDPSLYYIPEEDYKARFNEIYEMLPEYEGVRLYQEIAARLDIDGYFRKMGIDYLLKNGDYTDEIFLYARVEQDTARFYPIAWDYDDIFSERPHEVGIDYGKGTIYGFRTYNTVQDIYDEIGDKLIYSIEDDFDYTISQDEYLYSQYEKVLKEMLLYLDADLIDRVFQETKNELFSFYESYTVIEQSRYDDDPTSKEQWELNMEEKSSFLHTRLESMRLKLGNK